MIRKAELLNAILDLDHDLTSLAIRVNKLENSLKKSNSTQKSIKASTQPRDKSGKFTKKG